MALRASVLNNKLGQFYSKELDNIVTCSVKSRISDDEAYFRSTPTPFIMCEYRVLDVCGRADQLLLYSIAMSLTFQSIRS
jgi:hypothetical protein